MKCHHRWRVSGAVRSEKRRRLVWASIALALSLALASCGGGKPSSEVIIDGTPLSKRPFLGAMLAEPWPKPDFTLADTSGRPFSFKEETQGYVTFLYFGYTYCPDVCPAHMANIASALRKLPEKVRNQVKVVMVTVDPERDTPERLRQWLDLFNPSFIGLTGTLEEINEAGRRALGARWSPPEKVPLKEGGYSVNHLGFVIAYGKDNLARVIYPFGVSVDTFLHDIRTMVEVPP